MKYYISYIRESVKYAHSFEVQNEKIHRHAERNGNHIKTQYKERRSAYKSGKRPDFQKALKDLKNPDCVGIYFAKVDRSLRNVPDMVKLEEFIGKKDIIFINGEFDLSTAIGRKHFRNACIDACHYSEDLSEKILDSQSLMLGKKIYPYGINKYLTKKDGVITKNEHTPTIETMFQMYATGLYSYKTLAQRLNALGYRQPSGIKFNRRSVERLITNPLFCGYYVDKNGNEHEINAEKVITREFFKNLEDFRLNRTRKTTKKPKKYNGLIEYKKGRFLVGETVKGNTYYKSVNTPDFYFNCLRYSRKVRQVRETDIDQLITQHLQNLKIKDCFIENLKQEYRLFSKNSIGELSIRRRELNKKLENISEKIIQAPLDHMDGKFSADILSRILQKLEKDEKDVKAQLKNLSAIDKDFIKMTKGITKLVHFAETDFSVIPNELSRAVFELLFSSVLVTNGGLTIKNSPYLESIIKLSFELKKANTAQDKLGDVMTNQLYGGQTGAVFELKRLSELYKKHRVKSKIEFIQKMLLKSHGVNIFK